MNATERKRDACRHPKPVDRTASLWDRVEVQRERLFKGFAVIEVCRSACGSDEMPAPDTMADALQVACDLIDRATAELHEIGSDAKEQAEASAASATQ